MTDTELKATAKPAEKAAAKASKAKKAEPKVENMVYIGPNSLSDGLKRFTVYRGEPKELIEQASVKYKNIARLFVPVDELNAAMADGEKKGTPAYLAYNELMGARK